MLGPGASKKYSRRGGIIDEHQSMMREAEGGRKEDVNCTEGRL